MVDFPFDIPERTEFRDEGYSALGRGLTVACEYEGNCRALAAMLGVKSDPYLMRDESKLRDFSTHIWRRALNRNIKGITEFMPSEVGVASTLHRAREARNYLVHEAAIGLEHFLEDEETRINWFAELSESVHTIAEANVIVLGLAQAMSNEPLPTSNYLKEYPRKIVDWTCSQ